jgi:hypothetical protein
MLSNYLIAPSLNSLFFTGILLLVIFIIFIKNYKDILKLGSYQKILLFTSLSTAIGIHGLLHLGVEQNYNFNPYNWF